MKEPRYQRAAYAWSEIGNDTIQWVTAKRADLCKGNAVGLKLGGVRFRSRSGHICPGKRGAPNRQRHFFFHFTSEEISTV
jgi:hypothetical protein